MVGSTTNVILYVSPVFPPRVSAGVHRNVRFVRFLPEFGWEPIVLTRRWNGVGDEEPTIDLPSIVRTVRIGESTSTSKHTVEQPGSRSINSVYKRFRSFLRPIREFIAETPDSHSRWAKFAQAEALKIINEHPINLIFSSGPPHSSHLAAMKISCRTGIPFIADFRDPWARKPWIVKSNPFGQKLNPRYESKVVKRASAVILNTSDSCEDFTNEYPVYASKFHHISNGLDPDFLELVCEARARNNNILQKKSIPVICHPGSLYGHRNPKAILEAIAVLKTKGVRVLFEQIGLVSPEYNARQVAQELGVSDQFICRDPVSRHELVERMMCSDALLILQADAPFMVPAKLFEMMAFDQPIIAVGDSPCTENIVKEIGGLTAASRDIEGIARVIEKALSARHLDAVPPERIKARTAYDGRQLTEALSNVLNQVVRARKF